ncbi:MAG: YlmC/YmxH family sporulation protein [Clostridia bacterium]|nr:YlmC/YmxH family sporulation protein [Clostridia bacterium]
MSHNNCCSLNDLRKLEVINVCNGKRLGCICDLELDLCSGCILAILIPKKTELSELFCKKENRYVKIPWDCIERIGDDIVLVRL